MAAFDEFAFSLAEFSGTARLFPLPNLVLFPHVMQPLHVFEPRYRAMLEEALAGDQLVTMAMLAPGWEKTMKDGRRCLDGVPQSSRRSPQGDALTMSLVVGLKRVRLLRELPPHKSFREAKVEVCDDCYPPNEAAVTPLLQRKLRNAFMEILPRLPQAEEQLDQLLGSNVSLGALTDIISYMLDIELVKKEALLAEPNVHRRTELLLQYLSVVSQDSIPGMAGVAGFPPAFSAN